MNNSRNKKHITLAELKDIMQVKQKPEFKAPPKAIIKAAPHKVKPSKPTVATPVSAPVTAAQQEATERRQQRYQEAKILLEFLCTEYPNCFNLKYRKPLKVGIDKDILAKHSEKINNKALLTCALKIYTLNIRYWKAILSQNQRVDLAGNPSGEVTAEQKLHAKAPYERALANINERNRKMKKPAPSAKSLKTQA